MWRLWGPERLPALLLALYALRCLVNSSPLARTLAPALMPPVSVAPLSWEEITPLYVPGVLHVPAVLCLGLCTAALWCWWPIHPHLSCGLRKPCRAVLKGACVTRLWSS